MASAAQLRRYTSEFGYSIATIFRNRQSATCIAFHGWMFTICSFIQWFPLLPVRRRYPQQKIRGWLICGYLIMSSLSSTSRKSRRMCAWMSPALNLLATAAVVCPFGEGSSSGDLHPRSALRPIWAPCFDIWPDVRTFYARVTGRLGSNLRRSPSSQYYGRVVFWCGLLQKPGLPTDWLNVFCHFILPELFACLCHSLRKKATVRGVHMAAL